MKKLIALFLTLVVLAACAAPTPEVIEKEVVVEKPVVETVVVEREKIIEKEVVVTATPAPVETPTPMAEPKPGGTLIYGHMGGFTMFTPYRLMHTTLPAFNQLFNVLVRYDHNLEPQPELAESWEFSEDGLALTLHLRQGVKFHTGREFTADDVKFSLETVQDEETLANIRPLAMLVESVEVLDDYTVILHFPKPNPVVFDLLDLLYIVDKETYDEMDKHPVGTGPFKFAEWVPGDYAKFAKFDQYWREGLPYLDEVIVKAVADDIVLTLDLVGGSLDVAEDTPLEALQRLEANPEIELLPGVKGTGVYEFILNVTKPPFDNRMVRQAMQYALDRAGINDTVLLGFSEPWVENVPDYSPAYDPALADYYTFDLDKAKELLAEAGYPDGFEAEMAVVGWEGTCSRYAEFFQADLAKIGVKLNLREMEAAEYTPVVVTEGEYQIATHYYGRAQKDPASLYGTAKVWTVDFNLSRFYDDEYARLVEEGVSTLDPEKRREVYRKLTKIVLDESFALVIAPRLAFWGMQSYVKGLDLSLDNFPFLERAWLQK